MPPLMRLLVTGGAGYIGSIVAQQLVARGDEVTVLDSLYKGHRAAVPEGAAFAQADLLDTDALGAVFGAGSARLVEDTTGQGHTTATYGDEPCVTATIPLTEQ